MEPENTLDKSVGWRVWHAGNYFIGAIFFFFGSLLLFPYFTQFFNSALISAWLYTVGSFTFSLADCTQWTIYEPFVRCSARKSCVFPVLSVNFFMSMTGSIIYLFGSAMFLPQLNDIDLGLLLFIVASIIIMIAQSWKVTRFVVEGRKRGNLPELINQDFNGLMIDIFAGLGSSMYCSGSFFFFDPRNITQLVGCSAFSFGGFFFCISSFFMIRRYFFRKQTQSDMITVASSELKSESTYVGDQIEEIR